MNGGKTWKAIYESEDKGFRILRRVSRNVIEDRDIENYENVEFQIVIDGVINSYDIEREKLLELINKPYIKHPTRKKL